MQKPRLNLGLTGQSELVAYYRLFGGGRTYFRGQSSQPVVVQNYHHTVTLRGHRTSAVLWHMALPPHTRMKVVARVRPEITPNARNANCCPPEHCIRINHDGRKIVLEKLYCAPREFFLDAVLGPGASQLETYEAVGSDAVSAVCRGIDSTVLCYGQTGGGKTHTIFGSTKWMRTLINGSYDDLHAETLSKEKLSSMQAGLLPLALHQLFEHVEEKRANGATVKVTISFSQLYQERITDLLTDYSTAPHTGRRGGRREGVVQEPQRQHHGSQRQHGCPSPSPRRSRSMPGGAKRQQPNLQLREDRARGVYVSGLSSCTATSFAHAMEALRLGAVSRVTGGTASNAASSRSHAIITVTVEQTLPCSEEETQPDRGEDGEEEEVRGGGEDEEVGGGGGASRHDHEDRENSNPDCNHLPLRPPMAGREKRRRRFNRGRWRGGGGVGGGGEVQRQQQLVGRLTVVDLAGSERLSKSRSEGVRRQEAQCINKSIAALGNCVSAFAAAAHPSRRGDKSRTSPHHIPLRDSLLTRLLADSLTGRGRGGRGVRTTIITACSPLASCYDETFSSLLFASRALRGLRREAREDRRELVQHVVGDVHEEEEEEEKERHQEGFEQPPPPVAAACRASPSAVVVAGAVVPPPPPPPPPPSLKRSGPIPPASIIDAEPFDEPRPPLSIPLPFLPPSSSPPPHRLPSGSMTLQGGGDNEERVTSSDAEEFGVGSARGGVEWRGMQLEEGGRVGLGPSDPNGTTPGLRAEVEALRREVQRRQLAAAAQEQQQWQTRSQRLSPNVKPSSPLSPPCTRLRAPVDTGPSLSPSPALTAFARLASSLPGVPSPLPTPPLPTPPPPPTPPSPFRGSAVTASSSSSSSCLLSTSGQQHDNGDAGAETGGFYHVGEGEKSQGGHHDVPTTGLAETRLSSGEASVPCSMMEEETSVVSEDAFLGIAAAPLATMEPDSVVVGGKEGGAGGGGVTQDDTGPGASSSSCVGDPIMGISAIVGTRADHDLQRGGRGGGDRFHKVARALLLIPGLGEELKRQVEGGGQDLDHN